MPGQSALSSTCPADCAASASTTTYAGSPTPTPSSREIPTRGGNAREKGHWKEGKRRRKLGNRRREEWIERSDRGKEDSVSRWKSVQFNLAEWQWRNEAVSRDVPAKMV